MKKKITLLFVTIIVLLSVVLTGCSSGSGITQAQLDTVNAQLMAAQTQLTQAKADLATAQNDKAAAQASLQKTINDLTKQITDLKAQYEWVGLTPAQVAEKLVQNYHATHVYSAVDLFICGDMASEVWNMLKAQGISSVIAIGNKDKPITDILQSNHAWVVADVGGGQKLALETTAGVVMPQSDHPLYYQGWTFSSPTDLKANNDLIREYNVRVGFRNLLASEVNNAMTLYNNNIDNPTESDKYMTLYTKLRELESAQETILLSIKSQIDGLATRL